MGGKGSCLSPFRGSSVVSRNVPVLGFLLYGLCEGAGESGNVRVHRPGSGNAGGSGEEAASLSR